MTSLQHGRLAQGGGYGPPPGGPPPGAPPGGYGPPGGAPPGGYGGPPGQPPGGYGPPPGGFGGLPPGGGPPPGGYGQPPGGFGGYPPPPSPPGGALPGPAQDIKKQATTWLIVAAATFFLCGNCFGFIGGVLCFLAMQAADQNNVPDAESKLKWGKIITITGGVLAILGVIMSIIYYMLVVAAAVATS